ncbi:hypothetical protein F3Y22_tig00112926pilonHSYRG00041 [Hibiscus syriacus]|uniref:Uncharacterized protein n=1 Tax=Hibiscus syriacus TaxID=106335 RepID=A0A6A2X8S8_HIBSY|nr:hypothetical protein F3Y22_tig00112926pilonHSYRG00041 [Hibiscus syriacus]
MPDFYSSVKLKYVKLGYQYLVNHILTLTLVPITAGVVIEVIRLGPHEIVNLWTSLHLDFVQILCSSFFIIFVATVYFMSKARSISITRFNNW